MNKSFYLDHPYILRELNSAKAENKTGYILMCLDLWDAEDEDLGYYAFYCDTIDEVKEECAKRYLFKNWGKMDKDCCLCIIDVKEVQENLQKEHLHDPQNWLDQLKS